MSQFEFIMVMVALILALALAQALRGLLELVTSKSRYWPHVLWLVIMVFTIIQAWWADWDYNAIDEWQFTTYLLALASPTLIFAGIYLLVPATRSADVDWRDQFHKVRPWFFGFSIIYMLIAIIVTTEIYGTPLIHPYRLFQGFLIAVLLTGLITRNETVHKILPILFFAGVLVSQLLVRMNIGSLMAQ